jgi:uncharacterized membrane protein YccC
MDPSPLLRDVMRLDCSRLALAEALPGAIGFALPLLIGLAAGKTADGVVASTGALIVGFANLGGGYPVRAATLLATSTAVTAASLLGGLVATNVVLTVAAMGAWGFAGGLLVALGRRAAFVGMLSTWALLLTGDLGLHGAGTVHTTLLIAAGALLQTLIAVVAWPLRPLGPERATVADAYEALAAYAAAPGPATLAAGATALADAAETLAVGPPGSAPRGALRALVEQGEWIRLDLAALARAGGSPTLAGDDDPDGGDAPRADAAAVLAAAASVLEAIAASLRHRRGARPEVAGTMAELSRRVDAVGPGPAGRAATSLRGRVAAAASRHGGGVTSAAPPETEGALAVLRAQLTPSSSALRHAVRLAVALMVAVVAYRSLSLGRGYWVPLTVLFVLKPDYGTTFARGIGRAAGTMLGVALAWALVTALSPSDAAIVALLAFLTLAAYALYPANYALFSVLLTIVIALLAQFGGGSPIGALEDRLLDTALGGAIALAAFALWPTRETTTLGHRLSVLVERQRGWLDLVLAAYHDDDAYDRAALRDRRLETRRARAEAEAAVDRAQAEPARRRPDPYLAPAVLAAMERLAESSLVLASTLHDGGRTADPSLPRFERASTECLAVVSESLEATAWRPPPLPHDETAALDLAAHRAAPDDPLAAVVAPEARLILAALERLDRDARATIGSNGT